MEKCLNNRAIHKKINLEKKRNEIKSVLLRFKFGLLLYSIPSGGVR